MKRRHKKARDRKPKAYALSNEGGPSSVIAPPVYLTSGASPPSVGDINASLDGSIPILPPARNPKLDSMGFWLNFAAAVIGIAVAAKGAASATISSEWGIPLPLAAALLTVAILLFVLRRYHAELTWRIRAVLSIVVGLSCYAFIIGYSFVYQQISSRGKMIILVADFQGPEPETYRVSRTIFETLRATTGKYPEVIIKPLKRPISWQQGSSLARTLGMQQNANMVIWGDYSKTPETVLISAHFEIVKQCCFLNMRQDYTTFQVTPKQFDRFEAQGRLSHELSWLTLFVTALLKFQQRQFPEAIARFTDALLIPSPPDEIVSSLDLHYYRAIAYERTGQYHLALEDLTSVLQTRPRHLGALQARGAVYIELQQYQRAVDDLTLSIAQAPQDYYEVVNRAIAYDYLGEKDLAERDFNQAVALAPNEAHPLAERGLFLQRGKRVQDALKDYARAMELTKESSVLASLYFNRGTAFYNQRDYQAALRDYTISLNYDSEYAPTYRDRGFAYYQIGQRVAASADMDRALGLDPGDPLTRLYIAQWDIDRGDFPAVAEHMRIFYRAGRRSEFAKLQSVLIAKKHSHVVAEVCKTLSAESTEDTWASNCAGIALAEQGYLTESISILEHALVLRPNNIELIANLATAYKRSNNSTRALALINRSVLQQPTNASLWLLRAEYYSETHAPEKAFADIARAVSIEGVSSRSSKIKALALLKMGRFKEAKLAFDEALSYPGAEAVVWTGRGRSRMELGDLAGAVSDLTAAIQLKEDSGAAYSNRGTAKARSKDFRGAIEDFTEALKLSPNDPVMMRNRALAFYDQGHYEEALRDYGTLIAANPTSAAAYYDRAQVYMQQQKAELAIQDLQDASRYVGNDYKLARRIEDGINLAHLPAETHRLQELARAYYDKHELSKSLELFKQILALHVTVDHPACKASAYRGSGDVYYDRRQWTEAAKMYSAAATDFDRVGDYASEARTTASAALSYKYDGRRTTAINAWRKAKTTYEKIGGLDSWGRTVEQRMERSR